MSGLLAVIVLLVWLSIRAIKVSLGYPVKPFEGTTSRRAIRTAARYAAYSGLRGRRR